MANDYEGNTEYIRYWHGSIIFIKLLLICFSLEQIYIINAIVLGILIISLISILIKEKYFSIILNINAMDYVKDNLVYRINGEVRNFTKSELIINAIKRNITTLYPINLVKDKEKEMMVCIIVIAVGIVLSVKGKNKTKTKYIIILIVIAIIPYIRYIVLSQHSYMHSFFTFRSQIPTIMCLILILMNTIERYLTIIWNKLKNIRRK